MPIPCIVTCQPNYPAPYRQIRWVDPRSRAGLAGERALGRRGGTEAGAALNAVLLSICGEPNGKGSVFF
ncbi:hypothetical protein EVAR_49203_1 [Eumeta japonica]|uniref:Uncharacterized protein n=1 Tax=Eumeta variegata TaxID=151549 RepID=A0A4C1XP44_EUMVA|nr:hypothetical protein EVAR_49203_1 [Eumeta japonica]